MTRLNNHLRDQIVTAALAKSGNTTAIEAVEARRQEWAERVRLAALGDGGAKLEALVKRIEKLEREIPEGYRSGFPLIRTRGYLTLNCAGLTVRVNGWEGTKIAPAAHTLLADDPLVQQFHDICAEEAANSAQKDKVTSSVRAAVNGVTTVAKLLKVWPEAKELLPAYVEEAKVQLPALQVADLNNLVGLPSDSAEVN